MVASIVYDNPSFNVPRGYLLGYAVRATGFSITLTDNHFVVGSPAEGIEVLWDIDPRFYPASSNYYTEDFTLVEGEVFLYPGHIPASGFFYAGIVTFPGEANFRLYMDLTMDAPAPFTYFDALHVSDYWYPFTT